MTKEERYMNTHLFDKVKDSNLLDTIKQLEGKLRLQTAVAEGAKEIGKQLQGENDLMARLLSVAICPDCDGSDGSGGIGRQVSETECAQEQCEWCDLKNKVLKGR